ncbi:hypothetical protein BJ741DRAFT_597212 [Chytriomyces cf. hyalinus JEL632]|nr:hypothetical protein BJ741DRAFT_597212 [Chytriomyces cf. hyalinus JEL632]
MIRMRFAVAQHGHRQTLDGRMCLGPWLGLWPGLRRLSGNGRRGEPDVGSAMDPSVVDHRDLGQSSDADASIESQLLSHTYPGSASAMSSQRSNNADDVVSQVGPDSQSTASPSNNPQPPTRISIEPSPRKSNKKSSSRSKSDSIPSSTPKSSPTSKSPTIHALAKLPRPIPPVSLPRRPLTQRNNAPVATSRSHFLKLLASALFMRNFSAAERIITEAKIYNLDKSNRMLNLIMQLHLLQGDIDGADRIFDVSFASGDLKPNFKIFERLIMAHLLRWKPVRPVDDYDPNEVQILLPEFIGTTIQYNSENHATAGSGGIEAVSNSESVSASKLDKLLETDDASSPASPTFATSTATAATATEATATEAADTLTQTSSQSLNEVDSLEDTIEILESKAMRRAHQLFDLLIESGLNPSISVLDAIMRAHFNRGEFRAIINLFNLMKEKDIKPDIRIYTAVVEAYAIGLKDMVGAYECIRVMMETDHFIPDIHMNTVMMNAHIQIGDLDTAKQIFDEVIKSSVTPTIQTYGTLIHILCRAGQVDEAHEVVRTEIPRLLGAPGNHVMYNTLLQGYASQKGDFPSAIKILSEMKSLGLKPLVTTFNILISGHVRHHEFNGAQQWYNALLSAGLKPTLVTYNILINMYVKMKDPLAAQAVFDQIADDRLIPDTATIAPLIDYFSEMGDWEAVVRVIESSRKLSEVEGATFHGKERGRVKYSPIVPHNIVMERMRRNGNLAGVLRRFLEITGANQPSVGGGYDNTAGGGGAEVVVEDGSNTVRYLVEPDVRSYDILIRSLGAMHDVDSARYWMEDALKRKVVDTRLFNTMMAVYVNASKMEEAKEMYARIAGYGVVPDAVSLTLLLKANHPDSDSGGGELGSTSSALPPGEDDDDVGFN